MYKHIIIMVLSFIIAVCGGILLAFPLPITNWIFLYIRYLFYPGIGWAIVFFLRSLVIFLTYVGCRESGEDITHLPAMITDFIMGLFVFLYSCYDYMVDTSPAFHGLGAAAICFFYLPPPVTFLIIDVIESIKEKKNRCRKGWK